jgi:hypothetical protein
MAKFKCILSGNIIEFTQQVDIDSMVGHEGYVKVEDEPVKAATTPATKKQVKATEVSKEVE